MAIAEVFPYSNQHDLNLDWVISKIKEFSGNQISGISCEQIDANTVKFVITYTDGTTRELTDVILPEGPQGPQGETGATPNLTAGTITTLPAGSDATVSITGTPEDPVLNLGIPQGIQGQTGATGAPGGITNLNGYTGAVTTGNGLSFDSANGKLSAIDLNLTDTGTVNLASLTLPTRVTAISGSLNYAFNEDHTIGKIYGNVELTIIAGTADHMLIDTGLTVDSTGTYYIATGGLNVKVENNAYLAPNGHQTSQFQVINGRLRLDYYAAGSAQVVRLSYPASLYFFKDFGDTPNANTLSMRMAALSQDPIEAQER